MQNGGTGSDLRAEVDTSLHHMPWLEQTVTTMLFYILRFCAESWSFCSVCEKDWQEAFFPIAKMGCLDYSHAPGDSQVFSNIITPSWKAWSRETGLEDRIPELYLSLLYE